MRTKHYAHFTLFCVADTDCAKIPDSLNFSTILENVPPSPVVTIPGSNTNSEIPAWPESFLQADYTHTVMSLYVGFNAAWAVTCCIVIGKWKERAVEDSY